MKTERNGRLALSAIVVLGMLVACFCSLTRPEAQAQDPATTERERGKVSQIKLNVRLIQLDPPVGKVGLREFLKRELASVIDSISVDDGMESVVFVQHQEKTVAKQLVQELNGKTVAEPVVVVASGREATLFTGQSVPVETPLGAQAQKAEGDGLTILLRPELVQDKVKLSVQLKDMTDSETVRSDAGVRGAIVRTAKLDMRLLPHATALLTLGHDDKHILLVTPEIVAGINREDSQSILPGVGGVVHVDSFAASGGIREVKLQEIGGTLSLPSGHSVVVVTDRKVTRMKTSKSGVVNIHMISPERLLLSGQQIGQAGVELSDETDDVYGFKVAVQPSPGQQDIAKRMAAELIPRGMRVVAVKAATMAKIHVGDLVDVVAVTSDSDENFSRIVSAAKVFSVDEKRSPYLLLKVEDARLLSSAQSRGTLMIFPSSTKARKAETLEYRLSDNSLSMANELAGREGGGLDSDARQAAAAKKVQDVFRELYPKTEIDVLPLKQGVVVSGEVESRIQKQVTLIAGDYFPHVIDNLTIVDSENAKERSTDKRVGIANIGNALEGLHGDVRALQTDIERLIDALQRVQD